MTTPDGARGMDDVDFWRLIDATRRRAGTGNSSVGARNPLYCFDMSRQSGRGLLTTVLGFAGGAVVAASLLVEPPLGLLLFVVMAGLLVWRHPPLTTAVAIALGAAAVLFAIGLSNLGNGNDGGRTPGPWLLASAAFAAVAVIGAWIPHVRRRLRG